MEMCFPGLIMVFSLRLAFPLLFLYSAPYFVSEEAFCFCFLPMFNFYPIVVRTSPSFVWILQQGRERKF